ncbi:hypothetical protein TNCV_4564131 [Trichonephila clavipes]|nr:hypothetical protein TNCV_4564131 [Trichonephila clavipes]
MPQLRAMGEKEQKQRHIKGTENILLKDCTTTGVQNYDQKSPGRPGSGGTWNSLRSARLYATLYCCTGDVTQRGVFHITKASVNRKWRASDSSHMKILVYKTPVTSVEDLITRISVTARRICVMPRISENVKNSVQHRCQTFQMTFSLYFEYLF